jgi:molybdate transport system substrate-binding protein
MIGRMLLAALLLFAAPVGAAEIRVLCDGPIEIALRPAAGLFGQRTGHAVQLLPGTSPALVQRIRGGEAGDALIMQPEFLDQLAAGGRVAGPDRVPVGRIGIGLAMRAGAAIPAIATPAALRDALLGADLVVFNDVASGDHFARVLDGLGIAATLRERIIRTTPAAVFRRVLDGQGRSIAVGTLTQITTTPGLVLVGPLPAGLQAWLVYVAAPMAGAAVPEAAQAFIDFLRTPEAKASLAAAGAE